MAEHAIRGVVGQVKWGYYNAAAINGYTVTFNRRANTWRLRGTVVISDAFKMAQRPLLFVAPHAKGEWRWPIGQMTIANGVLTAELGPVEAVQ